MYPRKFTPEQECAIGAAYEAGQGVAALAASTGVSEATIRTIIKRVGISLRGTLSEQGRAAISAATKKKWQEGRTPPMLGKKLTPENREKALRNLGQRRRGDENARWNGGTRRIPARNGHGFYVYVYAPDHPSARGGRKYVAEHRLVMEKHLGRILTSLEQVQHINGVKDDNRIENLELVTCTEHSGKVCCPYCGESFRVR